MTEPHGAMTETVNPENPPDVTPHEMDDQDDDTPFTEYKRHKRRHRSGASNSSQNTIASVTPALYELTVIFKPTDTKKLVTKLNPLKLSQYLESVAPDGVLEIRPNLRLNLLALDTRNNESTKALLGVTSICGIPVRAYQPRSPDKAVGVIRGLPQDISDDEIKDAAKAAVPVVRVRRLGSSDVIQLVFQASTLPEHVCVGYTRFKVLPYTDKPRQCANCHRFGHIESTCQLQLRCIRCGKRHDRAQCTADQPRCPNCGKEHESTSRRCPAYLTEEAISKYRHTNHVSYVSARAVVVAGDSGNSIAKRKEPIASQHSDSSIPIKKKQNTAVSEVAEAVQPSEKDHDNGLVVNDTNFPPMTGHTEGKTLGKSAVRRRPSIQASRTREPEPDASRQSLGTAVRTILSMFRNMLHLIDFPFAKAIITLLDAVLPLTSLLAC